MTLHRRKRGQSRLSRRLQHHGISLDTLSALTRVPKNTIVAWSAGQQPAPRHVFRFLALLRLNLRLRRQIFRLRWLLWGDEGIAGQAAPTDLIGFSPNRTAPRTRIPPPPPTDPQCQADARSLIELHDWLADVYPGTPSLPALLRAAEILRKRTL